MENLISELDTARFGFKVAKVNCWEAGVKNILQKLQEQQVKLVISKIDVDQIKLINSLEEHNFRIKDLQLSYSIELKKIERIFFSFYAVKIREVEEHDIPHIVNIARESFSYGHYFENERLNQQTCAEIYADWAKRSCVDPLVANKVFVALVDDQFAGFLTAKIVNRNGEEYAVSELAAVSKKFRKSGAYQSLLKRSVLWSADMGLEYQINNVLASNIPVNRVHAKLGFYLTRSFFTLHGWIN
jgi:hypothetical protein